MAATDRLPRSKRRNHAFSAWTRSVSWVCGANSCRRAQDRRPGDRSQTYLVPGENPLDQHTRTFAAIEVACLDIIGKAVGKPVCDVVGGRVRDLVPFSAYLFYKHAGGGGDRGRCPRG